MKNKSKYSSLLGRKFGLLTVAQIKKTAHGHMWAMCKCNCGGERLANPKKLISGKALDCGCCATARNGKYHISYYVWQTMMRRCHDPKNGGYKGYGGRGISVCKEWHTFRGFLLSFPPRPSKEYQIDRIDVNGNYEPSNCRWVSRSINATYNKRNTLQEYEVKEIKTFLARGISIRKIAKFYDIGVHRIRGILNGKTYKSVP